jgi:hypothetical protein
VKAAVHPTRCQRLERPASSQRHMASSACVWIVPKNGPEQGLSPQGQATGRTQTASPPRFFPQRARQAKSLLRYDDSLSSRRARTSLRKGHMFFLVERKRNHRGHVGSSGMQLLTVGFLSHSPPPAFYNSLIAAMSTTIITMAPPTTIQFLTLARALAACDILSCALREARWVAHRASFSCWVSGDSAMVFSVC